MDGRPDLAKLGRAPLVGEPCGPPLFKRPGRDGRSVVRQNATVRKEEPGEAAPRHRLHHTTPARPAWQPAPVTPATSHGCPFFKRASYPPRDDARGCELSTRNSLQYKCQVSVARWCGTVSWWPTQQYAWPTQHALIAAPVPGVENLQHSWLVALVPLWARANEQGSLRFLMAVLPAAPLHTLKGVVG